jgi:preprotein translocase subunit SecA
MRNFGAADRMTKIMERFGMEEGEELEHPWLNKSVETAQKRVEQRNYLIRKRTLEFDDVMNQQRAVIYGYRNDAIETDNPRTMVYEVIDEMVPKKVEELLEPGEHGEPDYDDLLQWVNQTFPLGLKKDTAQFETRTVEDNGKFLVEKIKAAYELKAGHEQGDALKMLERYILLNAIDRLWQEHLYAMDGLREGVYLRAYGQKDPLVEYKSEAYKMFVELMDRIRGEVLTNLFRSTTNLASFETFLSQLQQKMTGGESPDGSAGVRPPAKSAQAEQGELKIELPVRREVPKVGRNEPCPCGSGKKFKACCGRKA